MKPAELVVFRSVPSLKHAWHAKYLCLFSNRSWISYLHGSVFQMRSCFKWMRTIGASAEFLQLTVKSTTLCAFGLPNWLNQPLEESGRRKPNVRQMRRTYDRHTAR